MVPNSRHPFEKPRSAIVVGAFGQDGQLLCTDLSQQHYEITRIGRTTVANVDGSIRPFNVSNPAAVDELVEVNAPDEIYYLAAHHHSAEESTGETATLLRESFTAHCSCLINFLDAMRRQRSLARLFFASSSLVFGEPDEMPQNENTPLRPVCAYGITKLAGMNICNIYRREHGLFCCSGILFNHESRFRSSQFVTKKIVTAAVNIHLGLQTELKVGSLTAQADWGSAADYVRAMRAILSLPTPDDFVVATGKLRSVGDVAQAAFGALGMDFSKYVREDAGLIQRAIRKVPLVGDASKLTAATGWSPQTGFEEMIREMTQHELASRDQTRNTPP